MNTPTEVVGLVPLPDGVYNVTWGGYVIDTHQPTYMFDANFKSTPTGQTVRTKERAHA